MTSKYILLLSEALGSILSSASFALARPEQYRLPGDITNKIGDTLKHPSREEYCWQFTDDPVFVHQEASENALDPILIPLAQAGKITQNDVAQVQSCILAKRGSFASILDIFPPSLLAGIKEYETMKTDGWFPDPPEEVVS